MALLEWEGELPLLDVMLAWVSASILKIRRVMSKEPGGNKQAHFPEQLSLSPAFRFYPDPQTLLPLPPDSL